MYNIYWNLICKNGAWLHCTRFWRHWCQNQLILMNMGTKNNFLWSFSHTKLQKSCVWTIFWCFCPFWSLSDVKLWTGQELGENSTKILFKLHTGFEGHEGEQIMTEFSFFGWTVPLTLNAISSAGNLSSRIFRDEFSSLVSSNCSLQGGTSDGLWSLFLPSLLSLKQFLILPFPLSEAADCVTSVTSFFCFSLHSLPLAQSVLAVVKEIQQMMDVFTLEEHFHGCTQSNHHNSTVFTEILSSSSSPLRASFTNHMHTN